MPGKVSWMCILVATRPLLGFTPKMLPWPAACVAGGRCSSCLEALRAPRLSPVALGAR